MNPCAFCGRDNDGNARYCIDCGQPLDNDSSQRASAAASSSPAPRGSAGSVSRGKPADRRAVTDPSHGAPPRQAPTVTCEWCGNAVDSTLPFCAYCGRRREGDDVPIATCTTCGSRVRRGVDLFCATCGTAQASAQPTQVLSAGLRDQTSRIALLDERGEPKRVIALEKPDTTIGRGASDIRIESDLYLSPVHAMLARREGKLVVRDLGSRNRTWVFITEPTRLADDDIILVGSQLLRFRRLGYPGAHPADADGTRGTGSLTPTPDVALLEQLRADGSVRDTLHLALGRAVVLGRDEGTWIFPYDQTMSARHAEIREQGGEFSVLDAGSRNGVAMAVRGERALRNGDRVLVGDTMLRVERA